MMTDEPIESDSLYRGISTSQYEKRDWFPITTAETEAPALFDRARYDLHTFDGSERNADVDHHLGQAIDSRTGKPCRRRASASASAAIGRFFASRGRTRPGYILVISRTRCEGAGLRLTIANDIFAEELAKAGYPHQEEIQIDNGGNPIPHDIVARIGQVSASGEIIEEWPYAARSERNQGKDSP